MDVEQWKEDVAALADQCPRKGPAHLYFQSSGGAAILVMIPDPNPPTATERLARKLDGMTFTAEEADMIAAQVKSRVGAVLAEDDGFCQAINPRTGKRCKRATMAGSRYCSLHIGPGYRLEG